ncbi:hypothetical protein [Maribellus sp. YY47]|uniref:hypothetical protein n=1 Tax=Maribellus sp. YY47 TaxID=2929486 RepID=UPI002001548C|nr:hypothetical protein [Maribellus sp. YY47]MCK3682619.1 hypothetical protein [Maribellus sp. YY47]
MKTFKIVLYIVIASSLLAITSFYFAEPFYHKMVAEDGPFENLTALALLAISGLSVARLVRQRNTRNKFWVILNVLIVLGTFFAFGEEISWGQRIFGIQSGEYFMQNNLQGETNLHNLEIGGVNLNKLIFSQGLVIVFGFYFVLSLVLYRRWNRFKNLVDLFGVPMPRIKYSIILLVCTLPILLVPDKRIWELWEALFATILLLVFIDPWNEKEGLLKK